MDSERLRETPHLTMVAGHILSCIYIQPLSTSTELNHEQLTDNNNDVHTHPSHSWCSGCGFKATDAYQSHAYYGHVR
jgi:hypothetical protein